MHSLQIDKITSIENLNHPNDYHIYFNGGCITFNPTNGPLRFWYCDTLVILVKIEDVWILRSKISDLRNNNKEFTWELNYGT